MNTVEKYRDLAVTLRERAELPAVQFQREQVLVLADHFDSLADGIVSRWEVVPNANIEPRQEIVPRAYAFTR